MIILRKIPSRPIRLKSPVAAIGLFDGVHRGHQAILQKAVERNRAIAGTPMAVTFYPHPLSVLAPKLVPPLLLSLEERVRAFERLGIEVALIIPFTRPFSLLTAEDFVRRVLVERLRVREVVVGHDFGFGAGRSGTVATLRSLGHRYGFKVHVVQPVKVEGKRVSSRNIREAIRAGDLKKAQRLTGRLAAVTGRVIRGQGRGRKLGFPTANLQIEAGVLPPVGVYAVWGSLKEGRYPGMANIGFRPPYPLPLTPYPLLEVHLFGVKRSLYGRRLKVAFVRRLRPERHFPSAKALSRQLARDASRAQSALWPASPPPPTPRGRIFSE